MKKNKILPFITIASLTTAIVPLASLISCKKSNKPALCFTATEDDTTISFNTGGLTVGDDKDINIQYKYNDTNWTNWKLREDNSQLGEEITLSKGQCIYVRNTKNTLSKKIGTDSYCFQFIMTKGEIKASGSVNSMINNFSLSDYCFSQMFFNCTSLTQAPELPATKLAFNCYTDMFEGCKKLKTTPELPATTLTSGCYREMFSGCTALNKATTLKANKLESFCYYQMFSGCTSLKINEVPPNNDNEGFIFTCPSDLPIWAVNNMFDGTSGTFTDKTPKVNNTYYWYIEG